MPRPRTPKALTREEEIAAVACVRAGRSSRRVGDLFGCSHTTIGKAVKRAAAAAPRGDLGFLAGCYASPARREGT